jgi:hypothetical protein
MEPEQPEPSKEDFSTEQDIWEESWGNLTGPEVDEYHAVVEKYEQERSEEETEGEVPAATLLHELQKRADERGDYKRSALLEKLGWVVVGRCGLNFADREFLMTAIGQIEDWKAQPIETLVIATFLKACSTAYEVDGVRDSTEKP